MAAIVHRTARIPLRATPGQRRRCFGLLCAAGDVRALILYCNRQLRDWKLAPVVSYQALCRELAGMTFGELDMVGIRSVARRYSTEWFESARRRGSGGRAGFPRRKKALIPLRYYHGTFSITGNRLRIPTARGAAPLVVRLAREVPYPQDCLRSVTLLCAAGRLFADVTAEVPVGDHGVDPARVAGVDLGIIHPFAVVGQGEALLVSGRALRAECHLHLADTKARSKKTAGRAPSKGQRGSKRWRQARRARSRAEARHARRIRQAHHEAAKAVVSWAVAHQVGTLVVGDPEGICDRDSGARQNRRLRTWRRTHLAGALKDKAQLAGIVVVEVDERGTSSTCPACQRRVPKPRGRAFACTSCGFTGHRDLVGATNIAARGGGSICGAPQIEHRRVGVLPTRRDRRRHLLDERRSCLAPRGHPGRREHPSRSRSLGRPGLEAEAPGIRPHAALAATGEDPLARTSLHGGAREWTGH